MTSEKKPKILLAITKSNWGGAQKYVFDLATGLKDQNFETQVILGGNGPLGEKLKESGIFTTILPFLGRDINFLADLKSSYSLYKFFRSNKPDILHLNSSKMLVLGSIVGRLAGIKNIIYTAHGWAFNEDRSKISKFILKLIYKIAFLFVNKIIFVSEQTKIQAKQNGFKLSSKKVVVIYNGTNIFNLNSKEEARNKILSSIPAKNIEGVDELNKIVWIGTIAELHKSKGLTYAIMAMSSLPENVHYFIIGDGEEKSNLELLIKELDLSQRIHLTGQIINANSLLSAFDLFVLPSITEALPYVILESGLAKLPTISTRVGGIPEIIESDYSGILINPRSPEELNYAINSLLKDSEKSIILGQNLYSTITSRFSKEKMLTSTINVYLEML